MEDKGPKVSIIVPVYNTEIYLKKCIDSICDQSYRNLEIFLIDDGSTDTSGKICDEYAESDNRIIVIHKENEGQAIARNCALDRCSGEYIAFVDSDDFIHSKMIEKMLYAIESNGADIAICRIEFYNEVRKKYSLHIDEKVVENETLMRYYFSGQIFTGMWNKLYKAVLFQGNRFPPIRYREDYYILHEVLGKCRTAVFLDDVLYTQYIREGSTERKSFRPEMLGSLYIAERIQEYVELNYPQLFGFVKYNRLNALTKLIKKISSSRNASPANKAYHTQISNELVTEYNGLLLKGYDKHDREMREAHFMIYHPFLNRGQILLSELHRTAKRHIKNLYESSRKGQK